MYAKNLPVPPKFDFPYQEQQRYSGSVTTQKQPQLPKLLSAETLKRLEEGVKNLETVKR